MRLVAHAPAAIQAILPYQPGKPIETLARERGLDPATIVKLASNENPLGMSPSASAAAMGALREPARYPDGSGFRLKAALAVHHQLPAEAFVLGNGSNDVLELAARAFLAPGRSAVFSEYAFAVYPLATQACGADGIEVPARHYAHDLDAMAAAMRDDTRVVFIANPNNPTGTVATPEQIARLLDAVPDTVLVVLDEAYREYQPASLRTDTAALLARHPNLLISRTFSKAYGMASLRIGYGIGDPALIELLDRIRQPFNCNSVALAAAEAGLSDTEFIETSVRCNAEGMDMVTRALAALGCEWLPSGGNFVTIRASAAARINDALLDRGIIVRPLAGYGMNDWLRVSIGTPRENQRFIDAFSEVLSMDQHD